VIANTNHRGNSTAKESIFAPPPQSVSEKWNNLSPVARIAIYASAAGVGTALIAFALWYCIKQRRRGAREAKLAETRINHERLELEQYKKAGIDPDGFVVNNTEYNAKDMKREGLASKDSYSIPNTPNSVADEKVWESKQWENAALNGGAVGAMGGMRSPAPLLGNGSQSPRVASPGPGRYDGSGYASPLNAPARVNTPGQQLVSPIRSPGPGMPPSFPPPGNPGSGGMRSFSTPDPRMRVGSPAQMGGYSAIQRTGSPAQMGPGPQRSFTGGAPYGGQPGGYRQDPGYGGNRGGYGGGGGEYWR
jgi:hypothetical protein